MKSKVDKSLEEVWEMKDLAYNRFKQSGYNSYPDYIKNRMKEIQEKYNIDILTEDKSTVVSIKID
ncbi:MAG: hypothetical protein ABSG15_08860 [FCB group bacterium]|jgi:hypothetical protein